MYCQYCGSPLTDEDLFCSVCGKPVVRKAPPAQSAPAKQGEKAPAAQEAKEQAGTAGTAGTAPQPPEEKPAVSDDDWDILERIFSKKR